MKRAIQAAAVIVLAAGFLGGCASSGGESSKPTSQLQVGRTQLTGVLVAGQAAIGAETTGWILDRGELGSIDVDTALLTNQANALRGKAVVVSGEIIMKEWTTRGKVKTLVADNIIAAGKGDAGPTQIPPAPRPGK